MIVSNQFLAESTIIFCITYIKNLNYLNNIYRCDLSLSGGAESSQSGNPLQLLDTFEEDLLVNDTQFLWDLLSKNNAGIVDIVLDNSGYEVFTDFCLAAFLIAHKLASKIRFYVKRYPWYVSDVTTNDFYWTIDTMKNSNDENLKALGEISSSYLNTEVWTVEVIFINFPTSIYKCEKEKKCLMYY